MTLSRGKDIQTISDPAQTPARFPANQSVIVVQQTLPPDAATDTGQQAIVTALGTPLQAGPVTLAASTAKIGQTSPLVGSGMSATQVTVAATATQLLAANAARIGGQISNPSATVSVIVGPTNAVTATTGYPIPPGRELPITSPLYTGAIWGIVATGTQVVGVLEFS